MARLVNTHPGMTSKTRITAEAARSLPRFSFIGLYLVVETRRAEGRGPLGLHVQHSRGEYRVVSPVAGGTVVYRTRDAARLFDYARRGELGHLTREADNWRVLAWEEAA